MTKNIFKNLHKLFLSLFGRKPKVFVTFNGIGAFTYALKLLGIEIGEQVYCELNDAANKTYRFNNKFKNSKFVNDINKLLELVKRGEKCDLLVQSPECQSFSQQGKRLGLESLSGNLFLTAIKLQKKIDSSIVIYENVKGLITHEKFIYTYEKENGEQFQTRKNIGKKKLKKRKLKEISKVEDSYSSLINPLYDGKKKSIGLTFRVIEEQLLEDDRYNYYWKIINAADQGIPQARERIIIIGIKKEIDGGFKFPENIELQFTVEDILETNVDESYIYKNENNHELVLSNSPKRKNQIYTYGKYKGVKYDSDSRVLNPYVASTILTGNNTKFKIDDVIRKLTPNENKKLNGFDDEFQFPVCKTAANKQNGNTVVSWVYARVFESLLNSIKPANSDTKFIKKELVGKYSMNYHFMREEIANEYMDFISNGGKVVVQIDKYNSKEDKKQKINHQTYFIEVEEFDGDRTKKEFDFEVDGKNVRGWAGVMHRGDRGKAGFALVQSDRVINTNYRPSEIFGDQDGGRNDLVNQRLVGEIFIDGFDVSHTKDQILWSGEQEEDLESKLKEEVKDLIRIALTRRVRDSIDTSDIKDIEVAFGNLHHEMESDYATDLINSIEIPSEIALKKSNMFLLNAVIKRVKEPVYIKIGDLTIKLYIDEDMSPFDPYVISNSAKEKENKNELIVVFNPNHPHWQEIKDDNGVLIFLRHVVYDGVSEWKAWNKTGKISHDTVKFIKDNLLRIPFEIEKEKSENESR